jgi:hypothetical protein
MTLSAYLKQNAGEFLLLLLSTWTLTTVAFNGFYLDSILEASGYALRAILALVVCAVLLLALYVAAYRRKRLVVGVIGYLVLLAVLVAGALALSSGENLYDDAEGNYLYLALVVTFACTGGFLLTRTLAGSTLWFLAAAFTCTVVQAFYETGEVAMSVAASLSALALIVHRNFKLGLASADMARKPSYVGGFVASVMPVCAAGALALLAWFAIIAPLDPGVMKITLITDYRQLPVEEYIGTADQQPSFNYELTSDNLVDGFPYTTDDLKEDPNASVTINAASVLEQQLQKQIEQNAASGSGTHDSLDQESTDPQFDAISWSEVFPIIIALIALVLLGIAGIVAYFVGRRRWRKQRLIHMLAQKPRAQVESMYRFELGRLARLGFKVPVGMTLSEYAASSARSMDMLTEETRVGFDDLTQTYQACVYGRYVPNEDEIVPFVAYYVSFWKAARTHLGNLRYFFKSFRL